MVAAVGNAVQAYNAALKRMGAPGIESRDNAGPGFSDVLKEVAKEAVNTAREAEKQSLAATEGKADLNQVVNAVTAAEVTVQTVTAVRDRVISAYQEILRMPI
ncbi:MAG: flagellar hook-basal body complex protein FliE [Rhodospirillaceae bacterium]|jgi:flagellar hook-basal body complex protein FliE|nr:flagellar hook-basal body complex protein FliE [Rhodospirillaceae bacterium]